ncbi:hypothetical protein Btru_051394 [Bulinus truncatus]|nr:hypothetical protein Btru_051394 [Bulinus truncatus]
MTLAQKIKELSRCRQTTLVKGKHVCAGKVLFIGATVTTVCLMVIIAGYTEVSPVHYPTYLAVSLPALQMNESLLDGRFKEIMDAVSVSHLFTLPTVPRDKQRIVGGILGKDY